MPTMEEEVEYTYRRLEPDEMHQPIITGYETIQILCASCESMRRLTHVVAGTGPCVGRRLCNICPQFLDAQGKLKEASDA